MLDVRLKEAAERGGDPEEAQSLNKAWWTENPMSYDWHGTIKSEPGTAPWFEEVDRRFLSAAYFAVGSEGAPFGRYLRPGLTEGKSVLEIGCGMGTHAALLAHAGAKLTAIDLSQPAVEMTRRRLELSGLVGRVEQADAERLPFPDALFDTVWSWGVLHHSRSFERCIDEVSRVLRPGGRLLLMVYHRRSLFYYLHQCFVRGLLLGQFRHSSLEQIYRRNVDGAYARMFTTAELRGLLAERQLDATTEVVGAKAELFPIPASRLKERLITSTPDALASAVLGRFGFFLVADAVRRR